MGRVVRKVKFREGTIGFDDDPHLYAYVGNNPVNWTDPWGLETEKNGIDWDDILETLELGIKILDFVENLKGNYEITIFDVTEGEVLDIYIINNLLEGGEFGPFNLNEGFDLDFNMPSYTLDTSNWDFVESGSTYHHVHIDVQIGYGGVRDKGTEGGNKGYVGHR